MPTYTIYSDTSDGRITSIDTVYSTARNGTGTLTVSSGASFDITVGQWATGLDGLYRLYQAYLSFDTSSVTGTISSVELKLYAQSDSSTTDFTVNARAYDWGSAIGTGDYVAGGSLTSYSLRASIGTSGGISTTAYNTFTSDGSFASNLANPVRLMLCSSRTESNTAPTVDVPEFVGFYSADQSGTNRDPNLVIVTPDVDPVFAIMAPRIPAEVY